MSITQVQSNTMIHDYINEHGCISHDEANRLGATDYIPRTVKYLIGDDLYFTNDLQMIKDPSKMKLAWDYDYEQIIYDLVRSDNTDQILDAFLSFFDYRNLLLLAELYKEPWNRYPIEPRKPFYKSILPYVKSRFWKKCNLINIETTNDVMLLMKEDIKIAYVGIHDVRHLLGLPIEKNPFVVNASIPFIYKAKLFKEIAHLVKYNVLTPGETSGLLHQLVQVKDVHFTICPNPASNIDHTLQHIGAVYRQSAFGETYNTAISKIEKDRLKFMVDSFNVF